MVNGVHFDSYYFRYMVSLYYIQVRSRELKQGLGENLWKLAVVVYPNRWLDVYSADDRLVGSSHTNAYQEEAMDRLFSRLGLDKGMFIPRNVDDRLPGYLSHRKREADLNLNKFGISKLPDSIGDMPRLKTLILSENNLTILPDSLGKLKGLTTLYLFYNQLSVLPDCINNMKQLRWLGLGGNPLPKKVISELRVKLPDTRIYSD